MERVIGTNLREGPMQKVKRSLKEKKMSNPGIYDEIYNLSEVIGKALCLSWKGTNVGVVRQSSKRCASENTQLEEVWHKSLNYGTSFGVGMGNKSSGRQYTSLTLPATLMLIPKLRQSTSRPPQERHQ